MGQADTDIYSKLKTFADYQQQKAAFDQARAAAGLETQTKQIGLIGQIVGNSAIDQNSYDKARAYAQKSGLDISSLPDQFNPDVVNRLRFAGATPTAQLSAMLQQQQMGLRAGIATGDVTGFGYGAGAQPAVNSPAPVQQPAASPMVASTPKSSSSMTPQQNRDAMAQLFASPDNAPLQTNVMPTPQFTPPVKNPGETQQSYDSRKKTLEESFYKDPNFLASQKTAETTAVDTAKANVEKSTGYTKAQSALRGFEQQSKFVTDTIDKAIATIDKPGSMATGYGQAFAGLPNTDARELNNYLNTIKANVGFDELQNMRNNSPTGGALGAISDMENKLLQAVKGAMDPLDKNLKANLETIKELYPQVLAGKKRAFEQDYGNVTPLGDNAQPVPASPAIPKINPSSKEYQESIFNAAQAIKKGANPEKVKAKLIAAGIDPAGLGM